MALAETEIERAAERLDQAERTRVQTELLSVRHPGIDLDDAYAIQSTWIRMKVATAGK
ncbi:2-keto-4-pentenoate hydratase [Bradyrhizobium sp. USDA 4469]